MQSNVSVEDAGALTDSLLITPKWAVAKQPKETNKRAKMPRQASTKTNMADVAKGKAAVPQGQGEQVKPYSPNADFPVDTHNLNSLDDIKRIFVHPFNIHLPRSVHLEWGKAAERKAMIVQGLFDELSVPMSATREDIESMQEACSIYSTAAASTFFSAIKRCVKSKVCVQLSGLLCHFVYWHVLLAFWRKRKDEEYQYRFLLKRMRLSLRSSSKRFTILGSISARLVSKVQIPLHSAFSPRVTAVKVLSSKYPLSLSALSDCISDRRDRRHGISPPQPARVLRYIDECILNILDPERYFSPIPCLEASPEAVRILYKAHNKPTARRRKADYRATSSLLKSIYPNASGDRRRYPGHAKPLPKFMRAPKGSNRKALYKAALSMFEQQHKVSYSKAEARERSSILNFNK